MNQSIMNRNQGPELHDRATRGESLTDAEQVRLESWYHEQDQLEIAEFQSVRHASEVDLRQRIDVALGEITRISQRIRGLDQETQELRRVNASLQLQVDQRLAAGA